MAAATDSKPDKATEPDTTVIAREAFWIERRFVAKGQAFPSSDPLVRAKPQRFTAMTIPARGDSVGPRISD